MDADRSGNYTAHGSQIGQMGAGGTASKITFEGSPPASKQDEEYKGMDAEQRGNYTAHGSQIGQMGAGGTASKITFEGSPPASKQDEEYKGMDAEQRDPSSLTSAEPLAKVEKAEVSKECFNAFKEKEITDVKDLL